MNILHLVSYAVFSGPLPPTVQLALAQRQLGHNAWVAHDTLRGAFSPFEEGADGPLGDSGVMLPGRPLGLSPKAGLKQLWQDRRTLRAIAGQMRLDVVHSHLSHDHSLVALSRLCGVARIHTVHATRQLSGWPQRRWLWRHTDGVVVRSTADYLAMQQLLTRRRLPLAHVPAAIDAAMWAPDNQRGDCQTAMGDGPQAHNFRQQLGIAAAAPLLVHVALMAGRGQRELLLAWAQLLDWLTHGQGLQHDALPHLALIGDGPERQALEQMRRRLGLQHVVHLPGYLPRPELRAAYHAAAGAFVAQPGNDAGARAALEAMAAGLPLIVVQIRPLDALAELAADGRAQLLGSRQPEEIAAALRRWWQQLGTHGALRGRNCAWLAAKRSPLHEAEATLALYRRVRSAQACQTIGPSSRPVAHGA